MKIAQVTNALLFYRSKTILDPSKLFWTGNGSKCEIQWWKVVFGLVQNILDLFKPIWTHPKQLGPIEGQGICLQYLLDKEKQKNIFADRKYFLFFLSEEK
jgi:hypothetical protein